jgi:hypothetical protein
MTAFVITTRGLEGTPAAATQVLAANWAIAAGTADAITAVYSPTNKALPDGLILGVRASAANATTTPTFAPDGLTAHTITRYGGVALKPGDIAAAGHELLLRYKLSATRWELLNPAKAYPTGEQKLEISANATLSIANCGLIHEITTDAVVLTLPATVVGAVFIVRNAGTQDGQVGINISPNASDKIAGNGFTATDNKDAINTKATAQVGDLMVLIGDGANGWFVQQVVGTWAREA